MDCFEGMGIAWVPDYTNNEVNETLKVLNPKVIVNSISKIPMIEFVHNITRWCNISLSRTKSKRW